MPDIPKEKEEKPIFNEVVACRNFLNQHQVIYANNAFFTPDGRVTDEQELKRQLYAEMCDLVGANVAKKVANVLDLLRFEAQIPDFPPEIDRIHVANGTLLLNGTFLPGKPNVVRNRLPVAYNPAAPPPTLWLKFLDDLLYPEDQLTLQQFIGYCCLPTNAGQRLLLVKGEGGDGKSQIGVVLSSLFGNNMKDGSIGKVSENRFARADLEHILLCVDDDMRMEALKQTNYVKAIVTSNGKMDLEKKQKQSYQGYMYARLMAFSNGDLQALYDRSDGFYRRQLILTCRGRKDDRIDDPYLGRKMQQEAEGIFLWAFRGLQQLVAQDFHFSESQRSRATREMVKRDGNSLFDFLESDGYIRFKADMSITSEDLYALYLLWCEENLATPLKRRSFGDAMVANAAKYQLEYTNTIANSSGRRVRGFLGIEAPEPAKGIMEQIQSILLSTCDEEIFPCTGNAALDKFKAS